MMYKIDNLPRILPVCLGRQTETGVNQIPIDCSDWIEQYPGIELHIWNTRPDEKYAYEVDSKRDGNLVIWNVTDTDTAIAGNGSFEVLGMIDGKRKLCSVCRTEIEPSILSNTAEPPESQQPWYTSAIAAAQEAKKAAEQVETLMDPESIKECVMQYLKNNPITVNNVAPDENGNIALPVYSGEVEAV